MTNLSTTEADMLNLTTTSSPLTTSPDDATYIANQLGAQHLPLSTIIPITVVYGLIFLVGVLGNVCTIVVILKNGYMHTSTNVYLANLAISDLLTHLVAMPFELYWLWQQYPWTFGEALCDAKMLTTETVTFSSIFTIVAFTVERYMAICHPLKVSTCLSSMSRAGFATLAIWICSVLCSLPWIYYNKVNYLVNEYTGEEMASSAWCAVPWYENAKAPLYLMITSTLVAFVLPFSIVTFLYFRIGVAMKKSAELRRNATQGQQNAAEAAINKGRRAVIRMLIAVVLVFFVCWSPFHAQRLMFVIVTLKGDWSMANGKAHHVLFLASGVGYYLSSCVNPLLYSVMSKRFRRGFKDMFCKNRHEDNVVHLANNMRRALSEGNLAPANGQANKRGPPQHLLQQPKNRREILRRAFQSRTSRDSRSKGDLSERHKEAFLALNGESGSRWDSQGTVSRWIMQRPRLGRLVSRRPQEDRFEELEDPLGSSCKSEIVCKTGGETNLLVSKSSWKKKAKGPDFALSEGDAPAAKKEEFKSTSWKMESNGRMLY